MSTLGDRIRSAREARGWLQAKLADEIQVNSAAVISNWEQGINKPNVDKLLALCKALNVTPSHLLGYTEQADGLTPEEQNIIETYRLADAYGRDDIDTCVKQVAKRCASYTREIPDVNIVIQPLFLSKDDPNYADMRQQGKSIKKLMKQAHKSAFDVVVFLWDLGYGNSICAADIMMVANSLKVPSESLYSDIRDFLTKKYRIVTDSRQ